LSCTSETGSPGPADEDLGDPPVVDKPQESPSRLRGWMEFPILVVIAVGLAVLIKTFLLQAFFIPSGSMETTLHGCDGCQGDRILVNKVVYDFRGIHRGDIVVFDGKDNYQDDPAPESVPSNIVSRWLHDAISFVGLAPKGTDYVKRVIGLPGDVVTCCDTAGRVEVNGVALNEPYVYEDDHHAFAPVTVPAGKLWLMGDHRSESYDSRYVGAVPKRDVIGRAFVTIWPPSRWRLLSPVSYHGVPAAAAGAAPTVMSAAVVLPAAWVRRRRRARRSDLSA
jgi:signal peptidase I